MAKEETALLSTVERDLAQLVEKSKSDQLEYQKEFDLAQKEFNDKVTALKSKYDLTVYDENIKRLKYIAKVLKQEIPIPNEKGSTVTKKVKGFSTGITGRPNWNEKFKAAYAKLPASPLPTRKEVIETIGELYPEIDIKADRPKINAALGTYNRDNKIK